LEAEVGRKIESILAEKGYSVASALDCDYVLSAFFAIDDGHTAVGARPVFHPGGTATTNVYTSRGDWATATTNLPGTTSYAPYSYTYYTRYLGATLYERASWTSTQGPNPETAVWSSHVFSSGRSHDLRSVVDYLLVATFDWFGRDSGKQISRSFAERDGRVKALRIGGGGRASDHGPEAEEPRRRTRAEP
jgi:hypothetical protein